MERSNKIEKLPSHLKSIDQKNQFLQCSQKLLKLSKQKNFSSFQMCFPSVSGTNIFKSNNAAPASEISTSAKILFSCCTAVKRSKTREPFFVASRRNDQAQYCSLTQSYCSVVNLLNFFTKTSKEVSSLNRSNRLVDHFAFFPPTFLEVLLSILRPSMPRSQCLLEED